MRLDLDAASAALRAHGVNDIVVTTLFRNKVKGQSILELCRSTSHPLVPYLKVTNTETPQRLDNLIIRSHESLVPTKHHLYQEPYNSLQAIRFRARFFPPLVQIEIPPLTATIS
jgi:hypothetical protein